MSNRIKHIESEIIDQYLYADESLRPWIIGFSGGKDSTVLLQIVWNALLEIPAELRKREVYVVSNDTMVENPIITDYVHGILEQIKVAAREQELPIFVQKTIPRLEDSFWLNIIGKGYPAPNNMFRWCTERLKIRPTSRFLLEQVAGNGEAIVLLGTRSDESATRAKSIKKHEIKGKRLSSHQQLSGAYVYAPIKHLMTEEIWWYIKTQPSPWGADNKDLYNIYADATADDYECPTMVTNKNHSSCGQSRFGCWVCTVVREDKSMSALIKNGMTWLKPLLEIRDAMVTERNLLENREPTRKNGSTDSIGAYTPEYRASLLKRVLKAQKKIQETKPHLELITNQELVAIQVTWHREHNFKYKITDIYNAIFKKELDMKDSNDKIKKEKELLKKSCKKAPKHFDLIEDMLILQKNKSLMNKKRGLRDDIENRIDEYIKSEEN